MRISIVTLLFLCCGTVQAEAPAPPAAQRDAMQKIAFLVGEWRGSGWEEFVPGQRSTSSGTMSTQTKLGGLVLYSERRVTATVPGRDEDVVVHEGVMLLSYDTEKQQYRIQAHIASGDAIDASGEFTERGLVWEFNFPTPGGEVQMRVVSTATGPDGWQEIGEVSQDGATWRQVSETSYRRRE